MAITNKAIASRLMKSLRRNRLRAALNRLALGHLRICRYSRIHSCCFCANLIDLDDAYRESGTLRAHEVCYEAVREVTRNA